MANLADTILATQTAVTALQAQVTALQTSVAAIPTTPGTGTPVDLTPVTSALANLQTTANTILSDLTPTP